MTGFAGQRVLSVARQFFLADIVRPAARDQKNCHQSVEPRPMEGLF